MTETCNRFSFHMRSFVCPNTHVLDTLPASQVDKLSESRRWILWCRAQHRIGQSFISGVIWLRRTPCPRVKRSFSRATYCSGMQMLTQSNDRLLWRSRHYVCSPARHYIPIFQFFESDPVILICQLPKLRYFFAPPPPWLPPFWTPLQ